MLVHLGAYGIIEMVIFVLILGVGLVYAWKKGPSSGSDATVQRAQPHNN
jgi:NADH:ubiquinone oxidoreductase subunit 3 (subunit A)